MQKYLLLTPVVVLLGAMLFLNYTVQLFKDTAYTFVYETNAESVRRFSREMEALSTQGYTGGEYGSLYTNMIHNYSRTLGEKEAIITFMIDENGHVLHSTEHNQAYLERLFEDSENRAKVDAAFSAGERGEITLMNNGVKKPMYYQWLDNAPKGYCLFMCVERSVVEAQLNANAVALPIGIVGILLLLMAEYIIWMKMDCPRRTTCEKGVADAD